MSNEYNGVTTSGYYNVTPVVALDSSYGMAGASTITLAKPSVQSEPVKIEDAGVSRIVRLAIANGPFEEVTAETDADTGVVHLTIGCQTHSIERWKRIGARLIRRHYGHDEKRLAVALPEVIKRVEAELKKK